MSKKNIRTRQLPLLPLRGLTVFPYMVLHFDVGRQKSIAALEDAMVNDQDIFLVTQKEPEIEEPDKDSLFKVGTVSKIKQLLKLPGDTIRVLVEGINREELLSFWRTISFEVLIEEQVDQGESDPLEEEALMRTVMDSFEEYIKLSNKILQIPWCLLIQ